MKQKRNRRGISIQLINLSFVLIVFLFSHSVDTTNHGIQKQYHAATLSQHKMIACHDAANALRQESDELTLYINSYLSNPEDESLFRYYSIIDQKLREQELDKAARYQVDCTLLQQALSLSNELAERERHAFALIKKSNGTLDSAPQQVRQYPFSEAELAASPEECVRIAHQLIHGTEYNRYKHYIYDKIDAFEQSVASSAENELLSETNSISKATKHMHRVSVVGNILIILAAYLLYRMVTVVMKNYIHSILKREYVIPKGTSELKYLGNVFNEYITLQKKAQSELQKKAQLDALTQTANRRGLEEFMSRKLSAPDAYGALILLDLDNFKQINDTYGHDAGDEVLVCLAQSVKAKLRNQDFIGRFGGDEFILWINAVNEQNADRIRDWIPHLGEDLALSDGTKPNVTVSAGVVFCKSGDTYEKAFRHADQALYEKKRSGKHGCMIYRQA